MAAYQVLARKWRPKTFADLVGQQHVVKALQNALDKGRLHHAYLLTGTRGVGKTTIARILAKSLNCETPTHGEPCGACQSCRDIDAGRFVDLLEIDAASNTGIDNIREVLENAQYAPTAGKYKVYIIDEVHMLSKSAFNAMLKTLEEPPEHVKFILATTDPHKVPITVLSRCLQFVLRNLTPQQVSEHLAHVLKTEKIVYEPTALALLGRAAQGSMRDALSLLDQAIAMGQGSVKEIDVREMIGAVDKRYLYELLTFLMEQDGEQLIAKAQEMSSNAVGFDSALNDLAMLLQRLALLKTVPSAIATDDPERERLLQLANYFGDEQIQLYYQCVIHGKQDLPLAPDEYAGFVMTLLRMLAFAPFAAKHTPTHGTIEGTQLHNPTPVSQKKTALNPPELAENSSPPPETPAAENVQAALSVPEPAPAMPVADVVAAPEVPPVASDEIPQSTDLDNAASLHPETSDVDDVPPWYDDVQAALSAPEIAHEPAPEMVAEPIADAPTTEIATPAEVDLAAPLPDVQAALPPLQAENWLAIVQQLAQIPEMAAAQMGLQHMAWVDYQDSVLTLAVVREQTTRHSVNPAYMTRIAQILSQSYQSSLHVELVDWTDGQHGETLAMYEARLQREQREHARALMQADVAVQQLQQLFGAKWRDESIQLLQPAS